MAKAVATVASWRAAAAQPGIDAKVAFLSNASRYPEATRHVEAVQTHLSWVFLTDRHAYKIKKPIRNANVDLRTVSARQFNCAEEVRLNRRLSSDVYLGTVALYRDAKGALTFDESGAIADWLVKMRRLPAERMLDRLIGQGLVRRNDVDALVRRLWNFYRSCPPVDVIASEYRGQFHDDILATCGELRQPGSGIAEEMVEPISDTLLAWLAANAAELDARVRAGRIVEGHGDLRPEHVCLEPEPQIIDCLEFSRTLRTLDVVDELGYLALECERLGAPELRRQLLDSYVGQNGDSPPDELIHFYQGQRACVRAMLALRHLREPGLADPAAWRSRTLAYLGLARAHSDRCR